ncbi:DUF4038 domain-containing protein [Paenibacillus lignilyticus]|uniref:DUF4038 domain-containing protein n=1 Tax=Paenibacillus lignilyticus TaxID=1172615 RepID=A0ABS5C692_9BACL|nr:DUF4038 domain-containing protein [Paenibacillus lignilyticus]
MAIKGYLQIAADQRSFQDGEGKPVFWLGDTAWACPGRATWEEWVDYVDIRSTQGFNVIQLNSLPQHDAFQPIFRGERRPFALLNDESADGRIFNWDYDAIQDVYFDRLKKMIAYANDKGMVIALIVLWFEHVPNSRLDVIPVHPGMTVQQAIRYGSYLIEKLEELNIVWVVSGDDEFKGEGVAAFYNEVGLAMKEAEPYGRLITTHPVHKSGDTYHHAGWLDFNMVQSGHGLNQEYNLGLIREEWDKQPPKPVLNAEPCYEHHPMSGRERRFDRHGVRRAGWRSVLEGSLTGITYGAHWIWNWAKIGEAPLGGAPSAYSWKDAIELPGAYDLVRMMQLLTTLPWFNLRPTSERVRSKHPFTISVASTEDGSLLLAYLPEKCEICLDVSGLAVEGKTAIWWNPERGERIAASDQFDGNEFVGSSPFEKDGLLIIS